VDLGADCVRAFTFDPARGVTGAAYVAYAAPPGSGPRWIAWTSPTRALLVSELASTLTLLAFADGRFAELDRCPTRAPGAQGKNAGGHVVVAGEGARAYCTNRGDDTVALFRIEHDRLAFAQAVPSGGSSPRFLCLIEERGLLLIAHEKRGPVHAFAVRPTGELTARPETIPITKAAWLGPLP
jgi:6-phosphogluconolactonase